MTDISFITDTILIYRKKPIFETPIRYDTDNIGIADIIDDIDTIDPSLLSIKRVRSILYATLTKILK